ncbi:MAG TPA: crotonase/enoyl-CoA hydratase family protein [Pseudomonas sp.]|nr:crotonase/enoyl-CoA hydratase family protein [Pseudomonas sp.]
METVPAPAWKHIALELEAGLATVCLNRPEKHNSLSVPMLLELIDCANWIGCNTHIRAVILKGNGPSFCSGMDLKAIMGGGLLRRALAFLPLWKPTINRYQKVCLVWRSLSVPVIAVIQGNCFGAGLQLALGTDIRVADPASQFSIMESGWGLVPDMGGTVLLRELISKDRAMELTLTGRVFNAEHASRLGLVSHIADDPLSVAEKLCDEIKRQSPDAVAAGKHLLHSAWSVSESSALSLERLWQRRVIGRKNQRIAVERRLKNSDKNYDLRTW